MQVVRQKTYLSKVLVSQCSFTNWYLDTLQKYEKLQSIHAEMDLINGRYYLIISCQIH
jgi:hypothetical protein